MHTIRPRHPDGSDDTALGQLMYDAIHKGISRYTAAQRHAWLSAPNAGNQWSARLAAQYVAVMDSGDETVGVMTLKGDYIDLAYVAPDWQGQGVFGRLLEVIEAEAHRMHLARLWTHASLMAQPAFLARGFHVIRHEEIAQKGETLARAEMEKVLS